MPGCLQVFKTQPSRQECQYPPSSFEKSFAGFCKILFNKAGRLRKHSYLQQRPTGAAAQRGGGGQLWLISRWSLVCVVKTVVAHLVKLWSHKRYHCVFLSEMNCFVCHAFQMQALYQLTKHQSLHLLWKLCFAANRGSLFYSLRPVIRFVQSRAMKNPREQWFLHINNSAGTCSDCKRMGAKK